jgi:hypothetical protein
MTSKETDKNCSNCIFYFKPSVKYPCSECDDGDKWEPAGSDLVHG